MSRVLLVDDDALLTELLTEYLTAEGLNVHSVPDGEAGVHEILTGQYDVVAFSGQHDDGDSTLRADVFQYVQAVHFRHHGV